MAWIKSVVIDGLAGRTDQVKFELNRDINVFWGLNGCGKTSLLRIIHSALSNDALSITSVPFDTATVSFYSQDHEVTYTRTISKELLDGTQAELTRRRSVKNKRSMASKVFKDGGIKIPWETTPKRRRSDVRFKHVYLPTSRFSDLSSQLAYANELDDTWDSGIDETRLDRAYANHIQYLWRAYSLAALRRTSNIQQSGLAGIARAVIEGGRSSTDELDLIAPDVALNTVESFFIAQGMHPPNVTREHFAESYGKEGIFRAVVNYIANTQERVDQESEPRTRLALLMDQLFSDRKKVTLGESDIEITDSNDNPIPLMMLSSGEKQIIRLFLECLSAEGNSLIVDEPELSMHVDWQHELFANLRVLNEQAQILAATHSPEITARLEDEKVFEL